MNRTRQQLAIEIELLLGRYYIGNYNERITSPDIASQVGVDNRIIREIISELRAVGRPLGFDSRGMFTGRVGHPEDLDSPIASIESRIHELFKVRRGLRKARRELGSTVQKELALFNEM